MLTTVFAGTLRHRRLVLTVAVALAVVLAAGRRLSPLLDVILSGVTFIAVAVLISLSLLALRRRRPAALLVRPAVRAFAVGPNAGHVYLSLGFLFLAALLLSPGQPPYLAIPYLAVVGLNVAAAWVGESTELRPDGVRRRSLFGSLDVPWDALAPGEPSRPPAGASALTLTYARPELVHRGGVLPSRRLAVAGVDAWFIADVIRHYVDHPQHRAAIGEEAEYGRLWQALTRSSAGPVHQQGA